MRRRLNLNRDWKFHRADVPGAEQRGFDDVTWQQIGLPHSFDLPYFRTSEFYVGYGLYRKRFDLRDIANRRVFLEFDGVFQHAEVFVNGQRIGEHKGGYTGFVLDITTVVREGPNFLAVRVNNNWDPQLAPRAGEHVFPGGIYRDVHLLIAPPVHFTWNGTFITTPTVADNDATIRIQAELRNASPNPVQATLKYEILHSAEPVAAWLAPSRLIGSSETITLEDSTSIAHPKLWHPDHPHLYTLRTTLTIDNQEVDRLETPFGIRHFEWTADKGFFLNGKHLYLRGANAHQDHAGWGIAITQSACERDVRLIKEAGFNFVRGAHYPHHPAFARACDKLGLLFWSENAFWGKGGFGPEGYWNASAYPVNEADFAPFEQSCRDQLTEMIRINRNSPSIIAWSMCNEPFFTYNLDRARSLLRDLVALSKKLDPTRPAAIGGAQRGDLDRLGDLAGYNGDGARLFLDPGVPNLVSEYGAISKPPENYDPFFGEKQPEHFPWRAGEAIWSAFDYGSIAGKQGLKGICTHARIPKRSWHWYHDHYITKPPLSPSPGTLGEGWGVGRSPALQLTTDRPTIHGTDAVEDAQLIVAASHPVEEITLTIDSGPGEFPTGRSITFAKDSDIPVTLNQAAIAFRSYHAGESIIRASATGFADATITITTTGEPPFIPGVTPLVADRPYRPPPVSDAARNAMNNTVNVALNRPSRASSETPDHPARYANDGNPDTYWSPAPLTLAPQWLLDLEGFYQLASLRLIFSTQSNHRFEVEISVDTVAWTSVIDRRTSTRTDAVRNDVFPPATIARYVRITFTSPDPALAQVELQGLIAR